jgi:hypothetical protein
MRPPLAPPRWSDPRQVAAEAQAVLTRSAIDKLEPAILPLSAVTSPSPIGS